MVSCRSCATRRSSPRSAAGTTPARPRRVAVRHLVESWSAKEFASHRPGGVLRLHRRPPDDPHHEEGQRDLRWPSNRLLLPQAPDAESDIVLLLVGAEPHLKWRTFVETFRDLFQQLGGARLVTLGALVAATTHTRQPPITGFTTEEDLQGPAGRPDDLPRALRRPDRHRRHAARLLPPRRAARSQPLGRPAALPRRRGEPARRARPARGARPALRLRAGPAPSCARRAGVRAAGRRRARRQRRDACLHPEIEKRIDSGVSEASVPDFPPAGDLIGDLEAYLRRERRGAVAMTIDIRTALDSRASGACAAAKALRTPRARDAALAGRLRLPALRRARPGRARGDRVDARPVPPLARPARRRGGGAARARRPRRAALRPARREGRRGSEAYAGDGIVQQAVRALKSADPELVVITDVCLCEYTTHGHCGV